jgi:hypothetical integral membrane protein (TIGR02206 family)
VRSTGTDLAATAGFSLFGSDHLAALAGIALASIGFGFIGKWTHSAVRRNRIATLLAALLLAHLAIRVGADILVFGRPWERSLPLHLCAIVIPLSAVMLVTRSYRLYEVSYFWALAAGANALLTPDLEAGFPDGRFILYFVGHGLPVCAVVYATTAFGFSPTFASIHRSLAAAAMLALPAAVVNLVLGTNYLYLCRPPGGVSLLELFGPWPWYLIGLVLIGWVSSVIVYLPFPVLRFVGRRRLSSERQRASLRAG